MARFDSAIALATRLIASNGQSVTLRTYTAGAPADANKPWEPAVNTLANQTAKAVWLDYSQKYVDETTIRTGDQKVFMSSADTSAAAITPAIDGIILRGSDVWKIVNIKPLNPNGQSIMYEIQVRQ